MGVAPLAEGLPLRILESAGLDELLGVIPCAAGVVQHRGQQHAADRSDDQEACNRLSAEQHSNQDRGCHRNHTWSDHLAQGGNGGDINDARVIRTRLVGHDSRNLAELTSHFHDDRLRRAPNGANGERAEEVREHRADEGTDEDVHIRQVDRLNERSTRAFQDQVHLVEIGREEQEGGKRCRCDRVPLGERLRRVADRVKLVGHGAHLLWCAAELSNTTGVVGDRSERVHRQDVGGGHEHADRRNGGAEDAELLKRDARKARGKSSLGAEPVRGEDRRRDGDGSHQRGLKTNGGASDDVRTGARSARLCDLTNRSIRASRIELGDVDECHAGGEADDASAEEPEPGVGVTRVQHHCAGEREQTSRDDGGCPVAAVQDVHWILFIVAAHKGHGHDRAQKAEGVHHEWEEDPRLWVRPAHALGDLVGANAQDHGADVLGSSRLKEVGAAAGAVANVVAHEVGDHAGVARVILWDSLLNFTNEVGANIGSLGVDTAAELGEERNKRSAEAVANDQERRLCWALKSTEEDEDGVDAE